MIQNNYEGSILRDKFPSWRLLVICITCLTMLINQRRVTNECNVDDHTSSRKGALFICTYIFINRNLISFKPYLVYGYFISYILSIYFHTKIIYGKYGVYSTSIGTLSIDLLSRSIG